MRLPMEVVQFISPEPILSVAAGGLGSVLGIEHFGDVLRNLTENDEKVTLYSPESQSASDA